MARVIAWLWQEPWRGNGKDYCMAMARAMG